MLVHFNLQREDNLPIKDKTVDPKTACDSMHFNEGHKILLLAKNTRLHCSIMIIIVLDSVVF